MEFLTSETNGFFFFFFLSTTFQWSWHWPGNSGIIISSSTHNPIQFNSLKISHEIRNLIRQNNWVLRNQHINPSWIIFLKNATLSCVCLSANYPTPSLLQLASKQNETISSLGCQTFWISSYSVGQAGQNICMAGKVSTTRWIGSQVICHHQEWPYHHLQARWESGTHDAKANWSRATRRSWTLNLRQAEHKN